MTKRSLPTLFMTGQELGRVATNEIGKHILKEAFDGDGTISYMLSRLDELGARKNCPVTLIIDGINEHAVLADFSQHLERFVEEVVKYPHLKLILTCREEYFEERFSNFRKASFSDQVVFLESFNKRMKPKHKRHMVSSYFEFFNLRYSYMSRQVEETLQDNTLLLRMFCDSYGDPDLTTPIDLQQVHDIYRYEVFRHYLDTKLANITRQAKQDGIGLGVALPIHNALDEVIRSMVESESFTNVKLFDINAAHHPALGVLVGEDIILRLDLTDELDPFGGKAEVINFTFDEFRDFLVARYLVNRVFKNDPIAFEAKLDALVRPNAPVAEGLKKYVFIVSRLPNGKQVQDVILKKEWFDQTFVETIFSVNDKLVYAGDIQKVKQLFYKDERNASWIIRSLVMRWDRKRYANLNINVLFDILAELDKPAFDAHVIPAVGRHRLQGYDGTDSWIVDDLVAEISEESLDHIPLPIMELLIYFLPRLLGDEETSEVMRRDFAAGMSTDGTKRITLTEYEMLGTG